MLVLFLAASLGACPGDGDAMADLERAVVEAHQVSLTPEACAQGGHQLAEGELATPGQIELDAYCGALVAARSAPRGFLTVFGSARVGESHPGYASARALAREWTLRHPEIPVATGGGPGIMEATNRGAREAGGRSIGFYTSFPERGVEKPNAYLTDGHLFTDFSMRERALFGPARAFVIYPGGFGTAWELFETLSEVQTGKKSMVPVVLVGTEEDWGDFRSAIARMKAEGSIGPNDDRLVTLVPDEESALRVLEGSVFRSR